MNLEVQAQHFVNLHAQISWQAQRFVNLHVQISWQAQRFVNLHVQISWQTQHFVNLEVQISWQAQHAESWKLRTGNFVAQLQCAEFSGGVEAENWRLCSATVVHGGTWGAGS